MLHAHVGAHSHGAMFTVCQYSDFVVMHGSVCHRGIFIFITSFDLDCHSSSCDWMDFFFQMDVLYGLLPNGVYPYGIFPNGIYLDEISPDAFFLKRIFHFSGHRLDT